MLFVLTSLLLLHGPASPAASAAMAAAPVAGPVAAPAAEQAPSQSPARAAAVIRFSPETLNLGEMIAGKPKTGTLTITNISSDPVTIEAIKGACGCTTVTAPPKDALRPGASCTVDITVDPGMRTGLDLSKAVHFKLSGGRSTSMNVTGHVKTVVQVSPDVVDLTQIPGGANPVLTLESVDGAAFTISSVEPAGVITLPNEPAARHSFTLDMAAWEKADRPAKLTIKTDKRDAETLVVPVKAAPAVVLYRLPAAPPSSPERAALEARQDAILLALDGGLEVRSQSSAFRMRLHRETGMLFVHGEQADADRVRDAVKRLPGDTEIREATNDESHGSTGS